MQDLPTPSPAAPDVSALALAGMSHLRSAADSMMVAFYTDGGAAAHHYRSAMESLHKAAAALGYALTPLPPAPVPAPGTAEALFEVAA